MMQLQNPSDKRRRRPLPRITRICAESGSAALFFAVAILPILFFAFSLTLDLANYYRETQLSQQILDQAALQAVRMLPFQAQARLAAEEYLARYRALTDGTVISYGSDWIQLDLTARTPLSLARFFWPEAGIDRTAFARARNTPRNVLVALDTSSYTAPLPTGSAWGDELEWPAAHFFESDYTPLGDAGVIDARNATQLCFNPMLVPLKGAASEVFEYFSGFASNAVAAGVFPGVSELDVVRAPVLGDSSATRAASFVQYRGNRGLYDQLCAAAAERDRVEDPKTRGRYRFPEARRNIEGLFRPSSGRPPVMMLFTPFLTWDLNPDYRDFLTAEEVFWASMASASDQDTRRVLEAALSPLVGTLFPAERGASAILAERVIVLIAGDAPTIRVQVSPDPNVPTVSMRYPDGGSEALLREKYFFLADETITSEHAPTRIIYAMLSSPYGPSNADSRFDQFASDVTAWRSDWEQLHGKALTNFSLQAVRAASADELEGKIAGVLVLSGRTSVLSR